MTPMHQRLMETLERISTILGATPEQHDVFQAWALKQLKMLVKAEQESRQALRWQAMEFKQEYLELQKELTTGIAVTGRTELVRAARRDWLAAVLDFVEAIDDRAEAA